MLFRIFSGVVIAAVLCMTTSFATAQSATAEEATPPLAFALDDPIEAETVDEIIEDDTGEVYRGGRGLISTAGVSGMFQNPTSGTLNQGQFTIQYCNVLFQNDGPNNLGHGVMVAYGVTDWLELGGFVNVAEVRAATETLTVGGPFVRVRLVKDGQFHDLMPEVSVGALYFDGGDVDDALARTEVFVALSKLFEIDPDGVFRSFRIHTGVRQIWRPENPPAADPNSTLVFVGGELELPYDIYAVVEVSNRNDLGADRNPYSFGIQWKPNNIVGISIAGLQLPGQDRLALYTGLGVTLEF